MRSAPFVSSTLNVSARTVDLVWTTGARVRRGYFEPYLEELSLDPKHVNMTRLQAGAPLLDDHDAAGIQSIIGVVESARLEKGRGVATVRFDSGARGEDAMRRVGEGTLRGVSVGYSVNKLVKVEDGEDKVPVYRVVDWAPHELTLTPIGADAGAHVRSNKESAMKQPPRNQHPSEIAGLVDDESQDHSRREILLAERERSASIVRIGRALSVTGSSITAALAAGTSVEAFRAAAVDARADAPPEMGGVIHFERRSMDEQFFGRRSAFDRNSGLNIEAGVDYGERRLELMSEALASRFGGPKPSEDARQYVRLSAVDFARHFLEQRGVNTQRLSKNQIAERSIGMNATGDFTNLLTGTGNRILRNAYESYKGGVQQACKQSSAPDFRPVQKLQLGEAATLQQVNEGGEFVASSMIEGKESYSLGTFGRIFGISRQSIVNDDLSSFAEMSSRLGRGASEFVAGKLAALLVSNPTIATDSTAVFHASHGNLTAVGTAISVASLGVALKSMRLQKGLDNTTPIDVTPKYLVVPAALETIALQTIAQITPAQTSNVNPFAGKLEALVDPRLDANSALAWYLAADPAMVDGIEYAFLDGTGPELFVQEGFRVDGVEWKIRLDFGAGFLDFRSWYKNVGA